MTPHPATIDRPAPDADADFIAWADELAITQVPGPVHEVIRARSEDEPDRSNLDARLASRSAVIFATASIAFGLLVTGGARITGILPPIATPQAQVAIEDANGADEGPRTVLEDGSTPDGSGRGAPQDPAPSRSGSNQDPSGQGPIGTGDGPSVSDGHNSLDDLVRTTTDRVGRIAGTGSGATQETLDAVTDLLNDVGDDVTSGDLDLADTVDDVLDTVGTVTGAVKDVTGTVTGNVDDLADVVDDVTDGAVPPVAPVVKDVTRTVDDAVDSTNDRVDTIGDAVAPGTAPVVAPVDDAVDEVEDLLPVVPIPTPSIPTGGGGLPG